MPPLSPSNWPWSASENRSGNTRHIPAVKPAQFLASISVLSKSGPLGLQGPRWHWELPGGVRRERASKRGDSLSLASISSRDFSLSTRDHSGSRARIRHPPDMDSGFASCHRNFDSVFPFISSSSLAVSVCVRELLATNA